MKKIISAALATAMAASMSVPAFAVLTPDGEPVIQGDIMLLSEGEEETPVVVLPGQTEEAPKYTKYVVEILRIMSDGEEESIMYKSVDAEDTVQTSIDGTIIFDINGNKKEFSDIEVGGEAFIFIDEADDSEIPAYIVIKGEEEVNAAVDKFSVSETLGEYVDTQNFLAINVSEETEIVDVDGNELTAEDIADKYLMVFYDRMTMSIPAITNPVKVIVLGEDEAVEEPEATEEPTNEPEYDYEFVVDGEDAITDENGVIIVPVRKYAEGLGLEVGWDGENVTVTVGTIPMGVSFKIGVNSYSKAKMTPFTLEAAPQIINDRTYVPVSFFEQVLNASVKIAK